MKQFLFSILLIVFVSITAIAQRKIPPELADRLRGKTRVVDIMSEVNRYYDYGRRNITVEEDEEFEGNDYEWWKKWEYFAMRRLLPDGRLANFKAKDYEALQQVQARFGTQLQNNEQQLRINNRWASEEGNNLGEVNNLSYGNWAYLGPPSSGGSVVGSGVNIDINGLARMDRIAFHPSNANIMYTGSPSGTIFKTTDGGTSWTQLGMGLPLGVACIEVAPSNGNVIYAFSGDGDSHRNTTFVFVYDVSPANQGLFKSTDAGLTWTKCADMYTGSNDLVGHQIAISHSNSNYLFCATDQGLYRTTDGGNSWTQVRAGNYFDVEFRPNDDSTVYTSSPNQVEYSTDGGRTGTWTASTFDFAPTATRIDLGVRRNNLGQVSTYVYALAGSVPASGQFRGLYRSTNSGVSFTRQCNTPNILGSATNGSGSSSQATYDLGITIKPDDFNYVVTAGLCVWHSDGSNGGTTMVYSTTYREGNGPLAAYIHPDIHDVKYNPVNNNLYATSDGGVFRSTDDGVTWTNLSTGLYGTQFYHFRMKDTDGDGEMDGIGLIGGAQDNGVKFRTDGGSWRHIICCDGYDGVIKGTDADWAVMTFNDELWSTHDGGVNMTDEGDVAAFSPMAINWDRDDTIYVASSGTLMRSWNGGQTFSAADNVAVNLNNFIVTCPSNIARMYGSSSTKTNLRRSDDNGDTWTTKSGNPGWPAGSPTVTDCKPWPSNSLEIYASFGGYTDNVKVYRSLDGGDNWTNYSGSLPNVPVHSLCTATEGVYAGTEIGVFFRADGAADWTPFYTGMPRALVTDMWVNANGLIYASTFGHGIWIADRYSTCPANITVSGNLDGPRYYEASSSANVTATSQSGAGTEIFVKSNGYVDLLDGFEIKDGTFFKAYLGPCSTGGIPNSSLTETQPVSRIIEYDQKEQATKKKQQSAYYSLTEDAIEVNMPANATLYVEVMNIKTNQKTILVNNVKLTKGMYKLMPGEGSFTIQVKLNGHAISKL